MFCRKCGKELSDNAYVCTNCGVLTGKGAVEKREKKPITGQNAECADDKETSLAKLFGMLAFIFIAISISVLFIPLITRGYYSVGHNNLRYYGYEATFYVIAVIMSVIGLGLGITGFVLGLKQKNDAIKFITTLIFIFSIFPFIVILLFI